MLLLLSQMYTNGTELFLAPLVYSLNFHHHEREVVVKRHSGAPLFDAPDHHIANLIRRQRRDRL